MEYRAVARSMDRHRRHSASGLLTPVFLALYAAPFVSFCRYACIISGVE